jgi:hypothetical protein
MNKEGEKDMAFCAKCGKNLPETGVCECGFVLPDNFGTTENTSTAPPPPAGVELPRPDQYRDIPPGTQVIYVKEANPLLDDFLKAVKQIFSNKPQDAIVTAINTRAHIWVFFLAIYIAIMGLAGMLILPRLIMSFWDMVLSDIGGFFSMWGLYGLMPPGPMFGISTAAAAIAFFSLITVVRLLFSIYKMQISFLTVLNLVAVSLSVFSFAAAAAIVFGLFSIELSVLLLFIGLLGSIVILYIGIQKAASFTSSPFWLFMIVYSIQIAVVMDIMKKMISELISQLMYSGWGFY